MESNLTLATIVALMGIMLTGALIPSVSVLTVVARSATSGFSHGIATTMGIAAGDIVFIIVAIFGLTFLAEKMDHWFVVLKYLGGVYLIWLGTLLWRASSNVVEIDTTERSSLFTSFFAGLSITLGDQKAILFYLGIFPAFIELSTLTLLDAGIIITLAVFAVSTKLIYALMADKASHLLKNSNAISAINTIAGAIIVGVGIFVIVRA